MSAAVSASFGCATLEPAEPAKAPGCGPQSLQRRPLDRPSNQRAIDLAYDLRQLRIAGKHGLDAGIESLHRRAAYHDHGVSARPRSWLAPSAATPSEGDQSALHHSGGACRAPVRSTRARPPRSARCWGRTTGCESTTREPRASKARPHAHRGLGDGESPTCTKRRGSVDEVSDLSGECRPVGTRSFLG